LRFLVSIERNTPAAAPIRTSARISELLDLCPEARKLRERLEGQRVEPFRTVQPGQENARPRSLQEKMVAFVSHAA